ncbi:MAG: COP9 signalosome [Monoraphidium minutum]|nr:MAG: COP9 signalosome [Monoraphidium minutum]
MAGVEERVQHALGAKEFQEVAPILDQAELESGDPNVLQDWPCALHLLGHVYNGNLEDARLLWKRIPQAQQQDPEADAAWRLLQYCWNRSYPGSWQALTAHQWSAQVQPLVDALVEKTRQRMAKLLATAYSQVSPAKAALLLGVSEADARQLAESLGWAEVPGAPGGPGPMLAPRAAAADGAGLDCRGALEQLTRYMVHLES